jgi:outer membrane autotransporter protein
LSLGLSYAQAGSSLDYQDVRSGNGSELDSHLGALYGSYDGGRYYIDAIANVAFNTYETNRQIRVGAINRQAKGNFNGRQYSAKVVAGYPMGNDGTTVVPMASAQATRLHLDSYTETGADALNLHVDAQSYDYLQTGLGVRTTFNMQVPVGTLSAFFKVMWLYDALDDSQAVTSIFTGDGGEAFTVNAPEAARHAAQLSAGLRYETDGGLSFVARYEAMIKDEYLGHTATATIQYVF